ncbi:MAG: alpha/beta fold hydrolase [Chloroflexales bacterium]|nr:alpha/beta fold hydrolase [Chloroflexales bacterium]
MTALASALGGALLGALAAMLMNFGISQRALYAIGEDLEIGQAALVTRVREPYLPPVVDKLALSGGTLMRPAAAAPAAAPLRDDLLAARFAAHAYDSAAAAPVRRYVPAGVEQPPVDPRQRDLVVAEFDTAGQARHAARSLSRIRRTIGRLSAGNIAIVTRDRVGRIQFQQTEDMTAGRGALFGMGFGALAGLLLFGLFGMAVGALVVIVNQGADAAPADLGTGLLVGMVVLGGGGAILCGLIGALIGAFISYVINFAYSDADLHRIAESVPAGKALLLASIYHHAGPPVVAALRAGGATLRHTPLPAEQMVEAAIDEARRAVLSAKDDGRPDTQQLITTRAGVRIYADWRRRSEQTIVLLHGAGGDHLAWQVQYPALHAAGFSTLALDLRGHGYSDRPRGADDYRLERFAEDVYDVLDTLAIRDFILVGHCFGGMVATMFHQAHPQLSRGYLLIDTAARAPGLPRWLATRAPWVMGVAGRVLEALPSERRRLFHADMQAFKGTRDIEPSRLVSDASHTTLRAWLLVYRGIAQYDGVDALRSMTQPVWVVVGEEDTVFTVEDSQAIQSHVPGSRLITVPGANHIIVVNNPEVVEQTILSFLRDNQVFARSPADAR